MYTELRLNNNGIIDAVLFVCMFFSHSPTQYSIAFSLHSHRNETMWKTKWIEATKAFAK